MVEVRADIKVGTSGTLHGVMCRVDPTNHRDGYLFAISGESDYTFFRIRDILSFILAHFLFI